MWLWCDTTAVMDKLPQPKPKAAALPSAARGGVAFLYVLPCADEDLVKLGFSRDPFARMHALHPRFYEFFDLERAFAVQTESVHDARALEKRYKRLLADHRAPSPLTTRATAGGVGEWYRGALEALLGQAALLGEAGHSLITLYPWVRHRLHLEGDALHSWAALLSAEELEARGVLSRATPAQRRVIDVLDAYIAFNLNLHQWLPSKVLDWHRSGSLRASIDFGD